MPQCPFCDKPISTGTTNCPYCRAPISGFVLPGFGPQCFGDFHLAVSRWWLVIWETTVGESGCCDTALWGIMEVTG